MSVVMCIVHWDLVPGDEAVRGQVGDEVGAICADCQYWCDGNVASDESEK